MSRYSFLLRGLLLFVAVHSSALAQDSLVCMKDIRFRSSLEKENYTGYFKDKDPKRFVALLVDIRDTASTAYAKHVSHEIEAVVNTLKFLGVAKRKPKRKIQDIYDYVHKTILKKYELIARFDEIFTNGTYNCVTATALYSIIFDALEVPYEIREKPTHVYLIAYPNAENIVVETTTPMFGYSSPDAQYKENFLATMKSLKLVSDEDLKSKSTDELFNKYYFTDQKINLEQLIGIHYSNDALFRADAQDLIGCYEQIQKAWRFFPSNKTGYLLKVFGITAISGTRLKPEQKSLYVSQLARLKDLGITNDMIDGEFHNLTIDVLSRNNNKKLYTDCYTIFMNNIDDQDLKNDLSFRYYYEMGRTQYNQGNMTPAKPYFQKALVLQPNNVDMNGLFLNTLVEQMRRLEDFRQALDSLHQYKTMFPALMEYKNFKILLSSGALGVAAGYFRKNQPDDASRCLAEFEDIAKNNPDLSPQPSFVEDAYLAGVDYYRNKKNTKKAKELAVAGLGYAPHSYLLKNASQRLGN